MRLITIDTVLIGSARTTPARTETRKGDPVLSRPKPKAKHGGAAVFRGVLGGFPGSSRWLVGLRRGRKIVVGRPVPCSLSIVDMEDCG